MMNGRREAASGRTLSALYSSGAHWNAWPSPAIACSSTVLDACTQTGAWPIAEGLAETRPIQWSSESSRRARGGSSSEASCDNWLCVGGGGEIYTVRRTAWREMWWRGRCSVVIASSWPWRRPCSESSGEWRRALLNAPGPPERSRPKEQWSAARTSVVSSAASAAPRLAGRDPFFLRAREGGGEGRGGGWMHAFGRGWRESGTKHGVVAGPRTPASAPTVRLSSGHGLADSRGGGLRVPGQLSLELDLARLISMDVRYITRPPHARLTNIFPGAAPWEYSHALPLPKLGILPS